MVIHANACSERVVVGVVVEALLVLVGSVELLLAGVMIDVVVVVRKACNIPEGWTLRDDGGRSVSNVNDDLSTTRNPIFFNKYILCLFCSVGIIILYDLLLKIEVNKG